MPRKRQPNRDAAGNDLAGKPVEYNASTGDVIVIGGYNFNVVDSYNNGVKVRRPGMSDKSPTDEFTYRELIKRGAFFAAIEGVQ